ncbi:hypothetical protein G647_03745 [Cladophialophora carrionii CBS 160.54]|uniref:NADPH--hemoprotein reductase n=1 Tax=Cladophialophora carrionii CBS 160.54 TaxID=1279043 RepID=V9DCI2_9EURO|nr:uncharacterized protein G647_03745 [Cladophialophora carrionii CBS 160.54]ETI24376.1 hypothetical protein G647_03745 [Cladophialophora carrionii CBS 160.54]
MTTQAHYTPRGVPADGQSIEDLVSQERQTITDMLLPDAPPRSVTNGLANADHLNPPDLDVLASALGAPARQVLNRAQELGPRTGWRDGYLTSTHGFCPPDPSAAPAALAMSPGRIWSDLCERMPAVVARGKMRESILALPLVYGTEDVIPDQALWAAVVCLGILASVYRYEERNDGHEGISVTAPPGTFRNLSGEADDEEEETKGIPRNIAIPLRQICTRMGRVLPHLTQYDVSVYNYKLRDPTSINPYVARCENMDLRWPVFNDRGEAMFLLCMAETHGCFTQGVELITRCQERVMLRDKEGLLRELIKLKAIVDRFVHVFQKISVNPNSGENFANPVEWGQRYAKFSAPLSKRVPALSGLALPVFLLMDAFIGRRKYDSFLGREALHLRAWLPMNIRAFIAAIEYHYQVPAFVKESGDPRLMGVMEGILEAYLSERGWFGTHRYKVYGFLEVVAKTGRSETNGNAGSADDAGRPWEEVHKTLSESMRERLEPFRGKVTLQPHELRGSFEECRFKARILSRSFVDTDSSRSTAMVTFGLEGTGMTFQPGDRLAIMPLNSWTEVGKVTAALGLDNLLQAKVPVSQSPDWSRFAKHLRTLNGTGEDNWLTVRDILRRGHLAPLTKDLVMAFHMALRASSSTVVKVLGSEMWPVQGTVGDLLQLAVAEVSPAIWDRAFDLADLSWLPKLIPIEVPRTYSISNYSNELLPSILDLTVARNEYQLAPVLQSASTTNQRYGVSSGCLNPDPSHSEEMLDDEEYLIGISRPLNFQLPATITGPVAMFAGGSGIAPFRGFWQARAQTSVGRNILFLGVQSRERFSYEHELRDYVRSGQIELHTAFSRDKNGLVFDPMSRELVEKQMPPRYLDAAIVEQGRTVCDLVISKSQGGLGGHLYVCGSLAVYETIMSGIRQAIYQNWTSTKESADSLLARAFAERRFMLDIFMSPRPVSYATPRIPLSKLALNTGHRKGSRMYIGVHGGVYDITDFLPIHPGGTLIAQASAGLDASKTFDDVAHTTNPEVMSLLSKYFIGHLATKPDFRSTELSSIYDLWYQYLRNCVEALTTLHFEVDYIQRDARTWFQGDLFNMGGVRKFYQFQSRLMQNGFSTLFGAKLQELHLKLTFALVNSGTPGTRVPDVIGTITRAQASAASAAAANEIAQIGSFVCNNQQAQFQENGILRYARAVTELDVQFLEEIREDVCLGMDAFEVIDSMNSATDKQRLVSLSTYLLSVLERVAERLDTFFSRLSRESIYRPELEKNPARTRWNLLRRKIRDGSFFILAQGTAFTASSQTRKPFRSTRYADQDILFAQVVSQAQQAVDVSQSRPEYSSSSSVSADQGRPMRLADSHTARAASSAKAPSSFEAHQSRNALQSISGFMNFNKQSIKRLSQLPSDLSFAHIMAAYGTTNNKKLPSIPPVMEVSEAHREAALRQNQRTNPQPSHGVRDPLPSASPERSMARRRGDSSGENMQRLVRRPTNGSISSATGLPHNPAPSAQSHASFIGRPLAPPQSRSATPASTADPPLPLRLASRSRSRSHSRNRLEDNMNGLMHRTPIPMGMTEEESGVPGPAVPAVQPQLTRRKMSSASASQYKTMGDAESLRNSPLARNPPMSGMQGVQAPAPGVLPLDPAQTASQIINDRLLAQMQQQNDKLMQAQPQSQAMKTGASVGGDPTLGGSGGLRTLKLAPAPTLNSPLRTRQGGGVGMAMGTLNTMRGSELAEQGPVDNGLGVGFRGAPLLPLNVR